MPMGTTFVVRCLVCGWKCRIDAGDIDQARQAAYTRHSREARVVHDDGGDGVCAGETIEVRWQEKGLEATFFVSCPACDWSSPVKADGTIQALRAGAALHAAENAGCARKAMEVDNHAEAEIFKVKIFG